MSTRPAQYLRRWSIPEGLAEFAAVIFDCEDESKLHDASESIWPIYVCQRFLKEKVYRPTIDYWRFYESETDLFEPEQDLHEFEFMIGLCRRILKVPLAHWSRAVRESFWFVRMLENLQEQIQETVDLIENHHEEELSKVSSWEEERAQLRSLFKRARAQHNIRRFRDAFNQRRIGWYWFGCWQASKCSLAGDGRKRDRSAFEADLVAGV